MTGQFRPTPYRRSGPSAAAGPVNGRARVLDASPAAAPAEPPGSPGPPEPPRSTAPTPGRRYGTALARVARVRGPASGYRCACGQPAALWSYDGTDQTELRRPGRGTRYSLDPDRYRPRCRSCARRERPSAPARTYAAAMQRVRTVRGRAAGHQCAGCGAQAAQWQYDQTDPVPERDAIRGVLFSLDPDRYRPMCRRCARGPGSHAAAVARVRRARGAAEQHRCQRCAAAAAVWRYAGGCGRHRRDDKAGNVRFSDDPADYTALCRTCAPARVVQGLGPGPTLDVERARWLYECGVSSRAIATRYGVSTRRVLTALRAAGVTIRRPGRQTSKPTNARARHEPAHDR